MKNLKEIVSTDYFKLFVKREGKVVLGKRYSSLWLLCSVLTVTFLAIAFSTASLDYLKIKMDDPFIKWVDIKYDADSQYNDFVYTLDSPELKEEFHFSAYQQDVATYLRFYLNESQQARSLYGRFFSDVETPLVQAILDEENIVADCCVPVESVINESFGVIITLDALVNKLGYDVDHVPAYIQLFSHTGFAVEKYGIELYCPDDYSAFAPTPIPVLAVVNRLPSNMDIIGTSFLYYQNEGFSRTLNLAYNDQEYLQTLIYFIPEEIKIDKFVQDLEECTKACTDLEYYIQSEREIPGMVSHVKGSFVSIEFYDTPEYLLNNNIHNLIMESYAHKGVERVYDYAHRPYEEDHANFLSVTFDDLNKITDFQQYAEKYRVKIEMSQISTKENFNEVTIMANILSWTMIVFAIVCIILFIVNLLQSYFQKVKRNLGTFKAFGMGNRELITVYVLIMVATIVAATVISLFIACFIQELLPLLGVMKDGTYDYLSLWSWKTFCSVIVILVASITTVYVVMGRLLKATPGDLIYDR